ncbi:hypothetical protein ACFV14_38265 [Streptomyces zaomyceticus]|uniref:hypothetical protein n=1 Tax=Streptomyces zaomyceticus TaxID=68286 RepID=UPI0036B5BAAF
METALRSSAASRGDCHVGGNACLVGSYAVAIFGCFERRPSYEVGVGAAVQSEVGILGHSEGDHHTRTISVSVESFVLRSSVALKGDRHFAADEDGGVDVVVAILSCPKGDRHPGDARLPL